MDLSSLTRTSDTEWRIEPHDRMRVPGILYGTEAFVRDMDDKVYRTTLQPSTFVIRVTV